MLEVSNTDKEPREKVSPAGFSERLNAAFLDSGMTKSELARRCNMTSAAIIFLINGSTKEMAGGNVFPIADALGVSARWLMTGKQPRPIDGAVPTPESDPQVELLAKRIAMLNARKRAALLELLDLTD